MSLLKKSEVLMMFEDFLVYGFQKAGQRFFQDEDQNARRLFTPSIEAAVLCFRSANERAYVAIVRKETVELLLESSSRRIDDFARTIVNNIFANGEPNFMRFFRYLAFILDLTLFAHKYKKINLMNDVVVECGNVFDDFLAMEEGLPFWSNFMALCDIILRNSPEHGRSDRYFRNPAVHWDPRDPAFNDSNPAWSWKLPHLLLDRNHPILKPDPQALLHKIWRGSAAENSDEGDKSCNLGARSLNIKNPKNSNPHPFDVIISAMCYNIHNIDLNPVSQDPPLY